MLPRVSRTFALNIAVLHGTLRKAVSIAYLICRIIDTIEDSSFLAAGKKKDLIGRFIRFLEQPPAAGEIKQWVLENQDTTKILFEDTLLRGSAKVIAAYRSLPLSYTMYMLPSVKRMGRGMSFFLIKYQAGAEAHLHDITELTRYCYYVAGTVGEIITQFFFIRIRDNRRCGAFFNTMHSFGYALQLTNILKDTREDASRGWVYIPADCTSDGGDNLIKITAVYLHHALVYTCRIPRHHFRLRLFCIIPLLLAAATLKKISHTGKSIPDRNNSINNDKDSIKISRNTVKKILLFSLFFWWSDFLLARRLNHFLRYCTV